MPNLDLTREWLGNVLRPYPSRDRIVTEVMRILEERRTMAVKTDAFTFNSGQTSLLLLLHGTLPITYRGATYQIPIHVWVPHEYPRAPPMAFVVPTKEMGVRKGREVDPSGRVKEEVVEEWWKGWQTKDIDTFLKQLASVFSAAPPVYAKPPEPAPASPAQPSRSPNSAPASPSTVASGAPVIPSRPGQGQPFGPVPPGRPFMLGIQTETLPQYRPAPTPPPQAFPQAQGSHSRQSSTSYPVSQPPGTPPNHPGSPAVPPRPGRIPPPQAMHQQSPTTAPGIPQRPYVPQPQPQPNPQWQDGSVSPMYMAPPRPEPQQARVNGWGPQTQQQHQQPQPQVQGNGYEQPYASPVPNEGFHQQPQHSQPGVGPTPPSHSVYQAPIAAQSTAQAPQPPPPQPSLRPARQPVHDLLSSPEQSTTDLPEASSDAPPPLPPSKPPPPSLLHLHSILLPHLQASLPPLVGSLQSTRAHLVERREDLVSGEPAIRDEMARLEAVKKVCDSTGRKLGDLVAAGEERVVELENRGETSVDELVCGISIVHNQLIDLVAEDNAIEDTIYHMTRALDAERVDLDRYLKSIRSLAREQYMKRALIERILQGMGQKQGW